MEMKLLKGATAPKISFTSLDPAFKELFRKAEAALTTGVCPNCGGPLKGKKRAKKCANCDLAISVF
jgi:ssDNA-binding Zn-finger/Zn-ribbon topoisomerase 1